MLLAPKSRLVMIGDSITDCERARPIGEGRYPSLGHGYVALVDALLGASYPHLQLRITNMGISGNNVRDLKARWQTDVLDLRPDWLSVMIGINDVWRQFDLPQLPDRHVYIDEYEATLDELIGTTRPTVKGLVVMSPYYIEPDRQDPMRAMMDQYGQAARGVAAKHDALFVDTQEAFDRVLEHYYPAALAWDRVHPNPVGHMVIARAFLEAVGFTFK